MELYINNENDITYMSELTPPSRIFAGQEAGLIRTYHLRRTRCCVSDVLI